MQYRKLGRTGIRVSAIAFGGGPVSGLMTGDNEAAQIAALQEANEFGINWIDTAAGYGQGKSESNIGRALRQIGLRDPFHIATKVRLEVNQLNDIRDTVRRSVEASLHRLGVSSITLLQLHNGLTARRGDEAFMITPEDVLGPRGVLYTFHELRDDGLILHFGLTGTGQPDSMRAVVRSGGFDTIQVPYHLLNPSAGQMMPADFTETDYGNIIADCAAMNMGVFAIRIFAGGALLGNEPSAHTLKTPFFPLELYLRDRKRAEELTKPVSSLKEEALRFVLNDVRVQSAIVGFGASEEIGDLVRLLEGK